MMYLPHFSRALVLGTITALTVSACSMLPQSDEEQKYPKDEEQRRKERLGKITGDEGLVLGGASEKKNDAGKNPLGVNSFVWRATLDTLSFLPISAADPWGGTILTDWYEEPESPGERYKVNVLILDRQLRADSVKITTFRQVKDEANNWKDVASDPALNRKLEDTVLTRARELRVKQLGY